MKCILCKQEAQNGLTTDIVVGSLVGVSGQTSSYTNFQPLSLWFCENCWRAYSAKEEANILNNGLTLLFAGGLGLAVILLMKGSQNPMPIICSGIVGLFMLLGILTVAYGAMKRSNPTDWSSKHIDQKKPLDAFKLFENIIPAIVHSIKGEPTNFWTAEEWKAWMKKDTNVKVTIYTSWSPREAATENDIKNGQESVQNALNKGDFRSALNICRNVKQSAFFCNLEGSILEKMGKKHEAITAYWSALLYNPNLVGAEDNIKRLTGE